MNKKILLNFILFAFAISLEAQEKVIYLYAGKAPGSEKWDWQEAESNKNSFGTKIIYNVVRPSLTVFLSDPTIANGTAVIICPGGGFQVLAIESEGFEVAGWLNKKGVTAFVLKYRLAHSLTDDPTKEFMAKNPNSPEFNKSIIELVSLDLADVKAAVSFVRTHAAEYKIATNRIGVMGFSAGGTVTTDIAYNYDPSNRPDFVAPIYPYVGSFQKSGVPADAPPMFIAAATDDQFGFHIHSLDLYKDWVQSKHVAEIHIYAKGGHGFGMKSQNLPTDGWIERFGEWLKMQGLLNAGSK
jgi:acetyl esterase/lipase